MVWFGLVWFGLVWIGLVLLAGMVCVIRGCNKNAVLLIKEYNNNNNWSRSLGKYFHWWMGGWGRLGGWGWWGGWWENL